MNKHRVITLVAAGLLFSMSSAGFASNKISKKLQGADISLQQAVAIAEQAAGGRAYKAKIEKDSFGIEYEVDLLVDERKVEVSVDARNGDILKIKTDKD